MNKLLKKTGKAIGELVKDIMDDSVSAYSAQAAFFIIISAFPITSGFFSLSSGDM